MLDSFIGQGAERAAKLTARFYANQWTDVYVMTGSPVSSADFEAEAMEERAERATLTADEHAKALAKTSP